MQTYQRNRRLTLSSWSAVDSKSNIDKAIFLEDFQKQKCCLSINILDVIKAKTKALFWILYYELLPCFFSLERDHLNNWSAEVWPSFTSASSEHWWYMHCREGIGMVLPVLMLDCVRTAALWGWHKDYPLFPLTQQLLFWKGERKLFFKTVTKRKQWTTIIKNCIRKLWTLFFHVGLIFFH